MTRPASSYAEYLSGLSRINPDDYQDAGTQAHLRALALPLDDLAGRARAVMLARLIAYAPEDALHLLGRERGVRRWPGEPLDTYRARVLGAWVYWQQAGTLPGLVAVLEMAGWKAVVLEHFRDPDPEHWAEFSVIITPLRPLMSDARWGELGDNWDGKQSWGFRLEALPFSAVLELIREMKPAHARLRRLLFSRGDHTWGGEDEWGNTREYAEANPWGSPWGEPSVVFRQTGDADVAWGQNRYEIVYEMKGAVPYAERD